MLSERLQKRLTKNRAMTTIILSIPVDVVESLKEIALKKGFAEYQTLLKSYISDGLRQDEARYAFGETARLIESLRKQGVSEVILEDAIKEVG